VAAGALSPEAASALRNYVSTQRAAPAVDEEHFRLITGFNDIFVGIAAAILLFAVAWIGQSIGPKIGDDGPSPFAGLLVAATAWGLAEFFTKKRRMVGEDLFEDSERAVALVVAASAAIAAGATYLHWKRFRVPITVAVGAATVVGVIMALIAYVVGDTNGDTLENVMLASALTLGVGVFLFAMRWDSSDPRRETRRSDVAFWLHLLSAPLIVHPIFSLLGLNDGDASIGEAMVVLLVYLLLGLTALAVDRRALLVSALAYVLFALISLFREFGAVELNIALAAFVIGSGLLLLSAFWHNVRKAVVQPLPAGVQARLPVLDRPAAHAAA
jgi:hypothetical protein